MSIEAANKLTMSRFVHFINSASEVLSRGVIHQDAVFHVPGIPEPMRGPQGYLEVVHMMRGGFPDIRWSLEEVIAEGDKLAARFIMRGTHRGAFFGVLPTGRKIEVQAMNFYRLSDGMIIEERGQPDLFGLMQQIGGATS